MQSAELRECSIKGSAQLLRNLHAALCILHSHSGGGTRTPDTRIMIPLL